MAKKKAKKKEIDIQEVLDNITGEQMVELVKNLPLFPLATHITVRLAQEAVNEKMKEVTLKIDPDINGIKHDVELKVTVKKQ